MRIPPAFTYPIAGATIYDSFQLVAWRLEPSFPLSCQWTSEIGGVGGAALLMGNLN